MSKRKENGQFLPGKSGNPSGRPSSEAADIRKKLSANAEGVIKVVMDSALGGDLQACKLILERISPPLKAQAANVTINIPDSGDMARTAETLIKAAANGDLPPDVASQMITAVGQLAHIVEVTELKDRLEILENSIKKNNY